MGYEVIPFKLFMATSMAPSPNLVSWVDGGFTFFVGTGVVLLGLIAAEKMGLSINESMIRMFVYVGAVLAIGFAIFKSNLFRHLLMGF